MELKRLYAKDFKCPIRTIRRLATRLNARWG